MDSSCLFLFLLLSTAKTQDIKSKMLRSEFKKRRNQGGTSGPKEWYSDEFTGFFVCFWLHISQTWSLSAWQPRNAMQSGQKKCSKSQLSLAKGQGKGQPRKARLLDDNCLSSKLNCLSGWTAYPEFSQTPQETTMVPPPPAEAEWEP